VFRFALVQLRHRADAEDALQEAMLALWKGAARFRGDASARTWIWSVARRKVWDVLRRNRRRQRKLEALPRPPAASEPVLSPEQQDALWRALGALPPEQREVVVLAFRFGYTIAEIASIADCPPGTVKSRMHHAKRKLAAIMGGDPRERA